MVGLCRLCAAAKHARGHAGTLSCLLLLQRASHPNKRSNNPPAPPTAVAQRHLQYDQQQSIESLLPHLPPPLRSAIANVINNKEDAGWGPNAVFR